MTQGHREPVRQLERGWSGTPNRLLSTVQEIYSQRARDYDRDVAWLLLGMQRRLRHYAVQKLNLQGGETVLDVACGTGLNFPAIEAAIGPEGRLIGFDYTAAMLEQARKRVEQQGWLNVHLLQGDVMELMLSKPVDAVLCTFAVGLFPNPRRAIERMIAALRPDGRIVIVDFKLSQRWYGFVINPIAKRIARRWVPDVNAYFAAQPWRDSRQLVSECGYEEQLGGILYLAWGVKPYE